MASWTVLSRRLRLALLHGCGVSGVAAAGCRTATALWEMLMLWEVPWVSGRRGAGGAAAVRGRVCVVGAAPEQGARRVGQAGAPPRAGPGDSSGGAVDVRAA